MTITCTGVAGRLLFQISITHRDYGDANRSSGETAMNENAQGFEVDTISERLPVAPWILCSLTTLAAIPIWFIGFLTIVDLIKPIGSPAGIPIYMMMCLVATIFVIPLNSFAIAPLIAKLGFPSNGRSISIHIVLGFVALVVLWVWPSTIGQYPSLAWTVIPFYLSIFLLPPILIGSLVFSISYNARNRGVMANKALHQTRGSVAS
ncbi:hypothetical protein [Pirellula sp. SH-Sr6A]|uniref:hypothetical protein n=1 Tax=Pirellula sp. SH-Sr6A TaxID=1632865 RepID=UPI0011BA7C3D|nr:hypothetical protein [Pirellula sp. SH-Sr6A]